uniref:Uncharacterized protein n=1 Tax=Timema tahoe TaxID=61484 RepID=A0A7R9FJM2_9NEOP|nr:unnamed protein product [Timema tahoe]
MKTTPSSPDRDSSLDLLVLGSLAQHETSVLSNYAIETGSLEYSLADKGRFRLVGFDTSHERSKGQGNVVEQFQACGKVFKAVEHCVTTEYGLSFSEVGVVHALLGLHSVPHQDGQSSTSLQRFRARLAEVGRLETPKIQGKYDTGQLFLHRVFGYRGVVLFPWLARVYDRDVPNKRDG